MQLSQKDYIYTKEKGAPDDRVIGNYYKDKILTNLDADFEEGIAQGWAYKADSIQELGEFFGIENLQATVYDIQGSYYGLSIDSGAIAGKESAIYSQIK